LDLRVLSLFESVYSLVEVPIATLSSERQGLLVLNPSINQWTGGLELPTSLPGSSAYWEVLNAAPISIGNFSNTKVAIIDTGFDDGMSVPSMHPDFQLGGPSVETLLTEFGTDTSDTQGHGTLTASIISGFTAQGARADAENFRFALGLSPGVKIISDKFFGCGSSGDLTSAIARVKTYSPNVVNLSWNQCGGTGQNSTCGYTAWSDVLDWKTRKSSMLFTVAAGNTPDDLQPSPSPCSTGCLFVRGPATARNALAVGASENFALDWSNNSTASACEWNEFPDVRDGRHVPSFSARKDPTSMIKPDLVAPGTRVTGPRTRVTSLCGGTGIFCNVEVASFGPLPLTYGMSAGTSFAAPAVAGAAAVVRKWYQNLTMIANPSPALIKAMLINGARDLGGPPASPPCPAGAVRDAAFAQVTCLGHVPDPYQGWGMLSLQRLLGPRTNYYFSDQDQHAEIASPTPVWQTIVTVNDPSRPVRVTIAYTDPGGNTSGVAPYRVKNDIDLGIYVEAPYNHYWYANSFDPITGYSRPNVFATDSLNNVEQIIIPPGFYPAGTRIRPFVCNVNLTEHIWGFPFDPVQDFAIVAENAR
jgi:hypothetical protein